MKYKNIDDLKKHVNNFGIEVKNLDKDNLSLQVGMDPVAYLMHIKDTVESIDVLEGTSMLDSYGKAAVGIYTLGIPFEDNTLAKYKGGTLIYHAMIDEHYIAGNIFKKNYKSED